VIDNDVKLTSYIERLLSRWK